MSEDGVGSGDSAVTGERKIQTSAHAVAFDRGDHRRGIAGDGVHQRLAHGGKLIGFGAGQSGDFIQVGANREKLAIGGDDQRAVLPLEFAKGRG